MKMQYRKLFVYAGIVLLGVGMALFARIDAGGNYFTEVLPAVIVFGLGLATTVAPLTSTALSALSSSRSGLASAINNDVARAAGLIAVAVLPAAAGITGAAYLHPDEFSSGFHTAVLIAAALCVVGGVVAALTIRNPEPDARPAPIPLDEHALHCGLDAPPPLLVSTGAPADAGAPDQRPSD